MLKKKYRLPARTHFSKNAVLSGKVILKISENEEKNSRFGFVVSKKVEKRAVLRNKIKRGLRRIVEENLEKIKPGLDLLFIVKGIPDEETIRSIKNKLINL